MAAPVTSRRRRGRPLKPLPSVETLSDPLDQAAAAVGAQHDEDTGPTREARRATSVRIPDSLNLRLRKYCLDHRTSINEVSVEFYRALLKRAGY